MFVLGHLGIGERLGRPFTRPQARRWLLCGCVLPDLLDKAIYGAARALAPHAPLLGRVGTRTVGHSVLFAALCLVLVRGARGQALFAGCLTHLALDGGGNLYGWAMERLRVPRLPQLSGTSPLAAIFFPFLSGGSPVSLRTFLAMAMNPRAAYVIAGELLGAALLLFDWRAQRRAKRAGEVRRPPAALA